MDCIYIKNKAWIEKETYFERIAIEPVTLRLQVPQDYIAAAAAAEAAPAALELAAVAAAASTSAASSRPFLQTNLKWKSRGEEKTENLGEKQKP